MIGKLFLRKLNEEKLENPLSSGVTVKIGPEKRILEVLGIPHIVDGENIVVAHDHAYALLKTLNKPLKVDR